MMLDAMLGSQQSLCCMVFRAELGLLVMLHVGGMQGKEPEIVESLAKYVTDEYQNKCQETVDTSEWPRRYVSAHLL